MTTKYNHTILHTYKHTFDIVALKKNVKNGETKDQDVDVELKKRKDKKTTFAGGTWQTHTHKYTSTLFVTTFVFGYVRKSIHFFSLSFGS